MVPSPALNRRVFSGAVTLLLTLCVTISTAAAQDPRAIVARAIQAMGGEVAVRSVSTIVAEYYTVAFAFGGSETADSPPYASVVLGRMTVDGREPGRALSQELRTPSGAVRRTRRVTTAGIGMDETDGRQVPQTASAVAGIERYVRGLPPWLLVLLIDHPEALTLLPPREWRGELYDGVRYALAADTGALYFDRRSGLLTVAEFLIDHPVLGDAPNVFWYTRWQPAGSVKLPRQVDVTLNGQLWSHTVYTSEQVNDSVDAAVFAIPDSIAARAPRGPIVTPPVTVRLVELARGIWRAEGGAYHSLVVEQPEQLVLIEAPQNNARVIAVLDTLRAHFPSKGVGVVVNTHHHWDVAGGLRPVIAADIPIVTHARNATFVRRVAAASKAVAPDELARHPRHAVLRLVEDSLVLGDGPSRVIVYALPTAHAEGLVAAYVPEARLLFTSDVLYPGSALDARGSAELVAFARAHGLRPDRFVGGLGGIVRWADVAGTALR